MGNGEAGQWPMVAEESKCRGLGGSEQSVHGQAARSTTCVVCKYKQDPRDPGTWSWKVSELARGGQQLQTTKMTSHIIAVCPNGDTIKFWMPSTLK